MPSAHTLPAATAGVPARAARLLAVAMLLAPWGAAEGAGQTLQGGDPAAPAFAAVRDGRSIRVELPGRRLVDVGLGDGIELGSLVADQERWAIAATRRAVDGTRRLVLAVGDDSGWREIPGPLVQRAAARTEPVLLGDVDGLAGGADAAVAWLEGDGSQRQAVRVARLRDGAFEEPETVAAEAPGSQVGLRGAVLLDGTWLLVWSAFDGQDNEIAWSWNLGGEWSEPARIGGDNRVPDVAPAVAPLGTGALVAWSRYDGREYRLQVSRLERGEWTEPTVIGGPGALDAALVGGSHRPLLLYSEASPHRWTVAELAETTDGAVRATRAATARTGLADPPVVRLRDDGVDLRWPRTAERRRGVALPARWSAAPVPRAAGEPR